ncbi:PAS domain S-box protein [Mesorhizobium sp. BAC0120]|nr:PAS domain S-box protein [Mesorhizobium sp. BAC0120]MDW6023607.1 PAS domain S-box protein [Mesorhizobium sp. BAC0120]
MPNAAPMEVALRTGNSQDEREIVIGRPDGSRTTVLTNVEVLKTDDRVEGAIGFLQEVRCSESHPDFPLEADSRVREIFDALPVAIYATDADGTLTFFNRAAAELAGRKPHAGKDKWCVSWRLRHADGSLMPHEECPMAQSIKEQRPIRGMEAYLERPDGTMIPFAPYPTPMFSLSGKLMGAVNMLIDLRDSRRANEAAQHLAAIVESSDDAIVSKDLKGIIRTWNKGAERLFGYRAQEVIGKPITIIIPGDRQDEEPHILERIGRGEPIEHYETRRVRKDGSIVDISLTVSPVRDAHGRVVGASKIARDISERKQAEMQRDLLVAELSHRVKNALATVTSIARQSFASNPDPVDAQRSFLARIHALSKTHSRLAESRWSGVSLETLFLDELAPYRQDNGSNVRVWGQPIMLAPKHAVILAMAAHELATNAAKHGALSTRAGSVEVIWEPDEQGRIQIRWIEKGGPKLVPPTRSGFGRLLVERVLASDLGSSVQMDFAENGLRCIITLPTLMSDGGA